MEEVEASRSGPRSTLQLLRDATFGPWFFGNLASNTGNWLFNVVAAVTVYRLSGSTLMVALVSVAQFGPVLVVSPWAGALSDRLDRRRLLLLGQSVATIGAVFIAVITVVYGVDGLSGAQVVIIATVVIGIGKALSEPALNSLVPALVPDSDLEGAVALTSLTFNMGRALGPAGAGVALASLGPEAAFVVNAASYVGFILVLIVIRPAVQGTPVTNIGSSVLSGLRYLRAAPHLVTLLGAITAVGIASDPVMTLAPALSAVLGGTEVTVAAFVSAFGIASILGAVVSVRLQQSLGTLRLAQAGLSLIAVSGTVVATAPSVGTAIVGFFVTGLGFVLSLTSLTSALQRTVSDQVRGRIMAFWGVCFLGSRPLAAFCHGVAADAFGARRAMAISVFAALAGVLAVRWLITTGSHRRPRA